VKPWATLARIPLPVRAVWRSPATMGGEEAAAKKRVLLLGDSITVGIALSQPGELTEAAELVGGEVTGKGVHHEGHGGKTTDWILERVAGYVDKFAPNVVMLMIGTNDVAGSAPIDKGLANVAKIVETIAPKATVVLATIPPFPRQALRQAAWNAGLYAYAKKTGTFLIDTTSGWPASEGVSASELADGVHPGPAGYRKIAHAYATGLQLATQKALPAPSSGPSGGTVVGIALVAIGVGGIVYATQNASFAPKYARRAA